MCRSSTLNSHKEVEIPIGIHKATADVARCGTIRVGGKQSYKKRSGQLKFSCHRFQQVYVLKFVFQEPDDLQKKPITPAAMIVFHAQKDISPMYLLILLNDSENCQKCPDNQWPNVEKDKCLSKMKDFLSYEQDIMAAVLPSISGLFLIITVSVSGIFLSFLDSPIVKANNRNISFILLLSLKLSLFCVFLFIGHPDDITCMLRQISTGVTFTVAVSSILAKTIMVSIAFKATRPGSSWRKWMGVTLPNSVVLICSLVQVLNGIIWLSVSPPFQEQDIDSYPGKIIIQCNEGSVVAFYFMLGYLGFLAAVSFVLAFMVRTLPDIYNEAKYITFSMLLFCSVWICAIPAYLSSKGKDMVMMEIFAILASEIGILGCIFFPKCYNIIMRPEMNSKRQLLEKQ
ncbi:vomeronasal type-2 receptor 26-like [Hyla sarda]|uniref:vomeronasal type-2 receptor 26-like n=1 Tax=Hyla sarda TaxID=327740 RepID=UPI0024C37F7B|nr:vomeronasal type-2 receptor 26-like [Hyla sarda]